MSGGFDHAFHTGARRAVIVGVDSPDIGPDTFAAAFDALARHDVVLGPATDGGYYLVGLRERAARRALPAMFENVSWGTDEVLNQTRDRLADRGLSYAMLAPLDDIDRPEDLDVWERNQRGAATNPFLSIVIPTWNEASRLGETLETVGEAPDVELIVVDAGSGDDSRRIAEAKGARVFATARNRAAQMNFGSAKANGAILMFLHADTRLPPDYLDHVRATFQRPAAVAGAFRFATNYASPAMTVVERAANWRSRILQLPYGDQALFLSKETFRRLGGFKPVPLMEDFDFARRLKRHGRIRIVPATAVTCGRRWRELGVVRTTLRNQLIILLYTLGVSPARLARLYRRRLDQSRS